METSGGNSLTSGSSTITIWISKLLSVRVQVVAVAREVNCETYKLRASWLVSILFFLLQINRYPGIIRGSDTFTSSPGEIIRRGVQSPEEIPRPFYSLGFTIVSAWCLTSSDWNILRLPFRHVLDCLLADNGICVFETYKIRGGLLVRQIPVKDRNLDDLSGRCCIHFVTTHHHLLPFDVFHVFCIAFSGLSASSSR